MKRPFYRYGHPKALGVLNEHRVAGDVPFLCLPLSEAAKDFAVSEAESVIRVAMDSGIFAPRIIATTVLNAWLTVARGSNTKATDSAPDPTAPIPECFLEELSKTIEWHYQNTRDPYNIDHAAISILSSIRISWAIAHGLKPRKLVTEKKEDVQ